jgi:uncharacterized protein YozE (UPF0346 family)
MRSCHAKDILAAVPNAQSFSLPNEWFETIPNNIDVFNSLYRWMIDSRRVDEDRTKQLHNRTYVGQKLMKRLLAAEERRIARRTKLRGEKLREAVDWSDLDSGPRAEFAERAIRGDLIIVLPEDDKSVQAAIRRMLQENREHHIRRIRDVASGANFYQWLVANSERQDPVGDIARDAMEDTDFPREAGMYEEVRIWLEGHGACNAKLDALVDAWREYATKYPYRIKKTAWCNNCESRIVELYDGLLTWSNSDGCQIVHIACCEESCERQLHLNRLAEGSMAILLGEFAKECSIFPESVAEIESRLELWGFCDSASTAKPKIYFIQAASSGAIKIGHSHSAKNVEKRRASLQTAHPEPLRLLAVMDGDRKTEAELHRRFSHHHLGGEWFAPHQELIAFISVLRSEDDARSQPEN